MNENVIKFRKPKPPKQPKQIGPGLRKVLTALAVVAFFVAAWAYYHYLA